MAEYNGWKLFNEVIIVMNRGGAGYIVDPKNKKSLQNAIEWSKLYDKDFTPKPIKTANNGFKVTIIDSAGSSMVGGKLSFWTCRVEKKSEGIDCYVGINADLLLDLIRHSTFKNGVCDKEVVFARKSNGLGLLHKDMRAYAEAVSDEQLKKTLSQGKTKKWQLGQSYNTANKSDVYLGTVYELLGYEYHSFDSYEFARKNPELYEEYVNEAKKRGDDPDKRGYKCIDKYKIILFGGEKHNTKSTKSIEWIMEDYNLKKADLEEIIEVCEKDIDKYLKSFRSIKDKNAEDFKDKEHVKELSDMHSLADGRVGNFFTSNSLLDSLPSRAVGEFKMGVPDSEEKYKEKLQHLINKQIDACIEAATVENRFKGYDKTSRRHKFGDGLIISSLSELMISTDGCINDKHIALLEALRDQYKKYPETDVIYTISYLGKETTYCNGCEAIDAVIDIFKSRQSEQ